MYGSVIQLVKFHPISSPFTGDELLDAQADSEVDKQPICTDGFCPGYTTGNIYQRKNEAVFKFCKVYICWVISGRALGVLTEMGEPHDHKVMCSFHN